MLRTKQWPSQARDGSGRRGSLGAQRPVDRCDGGAKLLTLMRVTLAFRRTKSQMGRSTTPSRPDASPCYRRPIWRFRFCALSGVRGTPYGPAAPSLDLIEDPAWAALRAVCPALCSGQPCRTITEDHTTEMVISALELQRRTPLHQHPVAVLVHVMKGEVELRTEGGEPQRYAAGSARIEAQGAMHRAHNVGDSPAKFLIVVIGEEWQPATVTPGLARMRRNALPSPAQHPQASARC